MNSTCNYFLSTNNISNVEELEKKYEDEIVDDSNNSFEENENYKNYFTFTELEVEPLNYVTKNDNDNQTGKYESSDKADSNLFNYNLRNYDEKPFQDFLPTDANSMQLKYTSVDGIFSATALPTEEDCNNVSNNYGNVLDTPNGHSNLGKLKNVDQCNFRTPVSLHEKCKSNTDNLYYLPVKPNVFSSDLSKTKAPEIDLDFIFNDLDSVDEKSPVRNSNCERNESVSNSLTLESDSGISHSCSKNITDNLKHSSNMFQLDGVQPLKVNASPLKVKSNNLLKPKLHRPFKNVNLKKPLSFRRVKYVSRNESHKSDGSDCNTETMCFATFPALRKVNKKASKIPSSKANVKQSNKKNIEDILDKDEGKVSVHSLGLVLNNQKEAVFAPMNEGMKVEKYPNHLADSTIIRQDILPFSVRISQPYGYKFKDSSLSLSKIKIEPKVINAKNFALLNIPSMGPMQSGLYRDLIVTDSINKTSVNLKNVSQIRVYTKPPRRMIISKGSNCKNPQNTNGDNKSNTNKMKIIVHNTTLIKPQINGNHSVPLCETSSFPTIGGKLTIPTIKTRLLKKGTSDFIKRNSRYEIANPTKIISDSVTKLMKPCDATMKLTEFCDSSSVPSFIKEDLIDFSLNGNSYKEEQMDFEKEDPSKFKPNIFKRIKTASEVFQNYKEHNNDKDLERKVGSSFLGDRRSIVPFSCTRIGDNQNNANHFSGFSQSFNSPNILKSLFVDPKSNKLDNCLM